MSRHQRLQHTMRSPQRAARRAAKHRPADRRPRVYEATRQPETALRSLFLKVTAGAR